MLKQEDLYIQCIFLYSRAGEYSIHIDIIGAGFGGISAAIAIKEQSPSNEVVIHEKYEKIGYNPDGRRCGEAHTVKNEWEKWRPSDKSIYTMITKGEITCGETTMCYHERENTGFILNRPEFIRELADHAQSLGVTIQTKDPIKSISDLDGTYILDASGSRNQFKRELGLKRGLYGLSYQETIKDPQHYVPDTIQIFWSERNGYFWIFPRNPDTYEINVGIGYLKNDIYHHKQHLKIFKKQQGIQGEITYVTSGIIPFGLQRPFKHNNILFVGDTAVGTFPLSGQGIYRALISGEIAGTCIAKGYPKKYPSLIRQAFVSREEVVCKAFLYLVEICRHVNPRLVLRIMPVLLNTSNSINRYAVHS